MTRLEDKVALVTGASRGIGAAIALELAARGAAVAVNYAGNAVAAGGVVEAIRAAGGRAVALQADVSDTEACSALVSATVAEFGAIDILVNNAGITRDGLLVRMSDDDWAAVIGTNLTAAFTLTRAAAALMMKARSGAIVNVSSVVGLVGNAGQANYAAAKAGLIGLTKAAARELAPRSIRVNVVAPGFIETEMTAGLPEAVRDAARTRIAFGRFGLPSDVATAVAFLASDDARYITGQVLAVDGGMTFV
ncbi:MAG TPA: 3-oxoacyl-[acyl-carrier-protein] reductase [Coriobacteriia bacterium]|nr:3-oxoacyl-[acyl-carrier-protein] reductase [Coriobacteriia bacterium]